MKILQKESVSVINQIFIICFAGSIILISFVLIGICIGSSDISIKSIINIICNKEELDPLIKTIIIKIRLPRVLFAIEVGASLSLGGLVFQALLRNPLAEPYILGISGGSAVGAITGIFLGFSRYFGVSIMAFIGSMMTLLLILFISQGKTTVKKDSLLLSGVMVNAFCSSLIMFFLSLSHDNKLHNILFWLMGDLSMSETKHVLTVFMFLTPCFIIIFLLTHSMNLLLMGKEAALSMGVNVRFVTYVLLITTSFMISITVCHSGILGFVGLVMPHLLRLIFGPDHRLLVPACILGGGTFMVLCDILARWLPKQGEMPVGVITAIIGAPLFIFLLRRSAK